MSDTEDLKNLYKDMYQAMIQKDTHRLNEILDDSFELIHMTGMHQNKDAYLKAIENGTLNYSSEVTDHIKVTVSDNNAEVIGQSRVHAAVFGGSWHTWNLQQDLTAVKKNGCWRFIKSAASTYEV